MATTKRAAVRALTSVVRRTGASRSGYANNGGYQLLHTRLVGRECVSVRHHQLIHDTFGRHSTAIWNVQHVLQNGRGTCNSDRAAYSSAANPPTPGQTTAATTPADVSPEDCDKAVVDLTLLKDKEKRRKAAYSMQRTPQDSLRDFYAQVVAFLKSVGPAMKEVASWSSEDWARKRSETWAHIKEEAHHYWVGAKLLWFEIKVSGKLIWSVLRGRVLTRRERQQLTQTSADVLRLVPFAVFVLIPFMEVFLPVALKLFPNMLPSTFQDKVKKEEELKKRVAVKIEVAAFLQDTVEEMAKEIKRTRSGETAGSARELGFFIEKVRKGDYVSNADIVRFATLFNDELTLDNLERVQLSSLCKLIGIEAFGTDGFLRYQLRNHLRKLKGDDHLIRNEGIDSLRDDELRSACRARGMRAVYGPNSRVIMEKQLEDWLDLSLNSRLPSSLLILSRAFLVTREPDKVVKELQETLSALPEDLLQEVSHTKYNADHRDDVKPGTAAATARKLEYLKHQDELIQEEKAAETEEAARAAELVAKGGAIEPELGTEGTTRLAEARKRRMAQIKAAFKVLASSSSVSAERELFLGLVKKEMKLYSEVLAAKGGASLLFQHGRLELAAKEDDDEDHDTAARISGRVDAMLEKIEEELDDVDRNIGEKLKVLDLDNDGVVSKEELGEAMAFLKGTLGEGELGKLLERLDADLGGEGDVHVDKLLAAIDGMDGEEKGTKGGKADGSEAEAEAKAA